MKPREKEKELTRYVGAVDLAHAIIRERFRMGGTVWLGWLVEQLIKRGRSSDVAEDAANRALCEISPLWQAMQRAK